MNRWINMIRRKKETTTKDAEFLTCPNCGAVLHTKEEGAAKAAFCAEIQEKGACVINLAKCLKCGTTVDCQEVYAGNFDSDK